MARQRPTPRLSQALTRLVGVFALVAMMFSVALGGSRYFFCPGMERVHVTDPCCAHFEPSIADRAQASRDAEHMTIDEDEHCCEARHHGLLPGAVAAAEAPSFEAPWVGLLPALPSFEIEGAVVAQRTLPLRGETGPPPDSARETCARLSIFLI